MLVIGLLAAGAGALVVFALSIATTTESTKKEWKDATRIERARSKVLEMLFSLSFFAFIFSSLILMGPNGTPGARAVCAASIFALVVVGRLMARYHIDDGIA